MHSRCIVVKFDWTDGMEVESVQSASAYVGVVGAEMMLASTECMLYISLKCWRVPDESWRVVSLCWRG